MVDPVDPDASGTMLKLIQQSGYVPPHNFLNAGQTIEGAEQGKVVTFSKKRSVDAVGGRVFIHTIDEDGTPIETWKLYNPWIKSVNFGDLDYESDDLVNVELTMRYDWADKDLTNIPRLQRNALSNTGVVVQGEGADSGII